MGHRADRFVVAQGQGALASLLLPVRPGAVQGMLQDRKLVGVVAHIVHQPGRQHRLDLGTLHPDRIDDRGAALLRGQPGHQVETGVDRLGQAGELGAVTQKIRPHRQHHEDRAILLLLQLQQ